MGRDPKGSPPHQRRRRPGKTRRRSCFCFIGLKKYSAAKKKEEEEEEEEEEEKQTQITDRADAIRRIKKKTKNGAGDARLTAAFGSRPILISATIYGAVGRLSLRIHRPSSTHFNAATSHKKTNKQTNKQKSKTNSSKKNNKSDALESRPTLGHRMLLPKKKDVAEIQWLRRSCYWPSNVP